MVIKLKSSIRYEIFLVAMWLVWSVMFTTTINFFLGLGMLYGRPYLLVRACIIGGAIGCVFLGIVLLWSTINYLVSIWTAERSRKIVFDKIPCELLMMVVLLFGISWKEEQLSAYEPFFWRYIEEGSLYYLVYDFIDSISQQIMLQGILWVSLWLLLRQICYHFLSDTSLLQRAYQRYHRSSEIGKKMIKRHGIYWGLMIGAVVFAGMAILFGINCDDDMATICAIIFLLCQLGIVFYQRISGISAPEIVSLLAQIRAVSQAEPLEEGFRISKKSLFYESFHQLEELDEAVKRSAKKQLQAERLKVDLITNVSHDLKTPLTSMVGYTDLLKQEELTPEARDYVDIISVKQEQLKEMIQQLFELSKATSGVDQLKIETLDMRKLMEQILGDMEDRIRESGQTIRSKFGEPPLFFAGDNEKMYRVVQNLLENALKYSLENTRIYIDVSRKKDKIVLQMKNIASYEMHFDPKEITERFVRADRSRNTEGHGLGLAIASSFTQNMGGILNIEVDGDLFKVMVEFPAVAEPDA